MNVSVAGSGQPCCAHAHAITNAIERKCLCCHSAFIAAGAEYDRHQDAPVPEDVGADDAASDGTHEGVEEGGWEEELPQE